MLNRLSLTLIIWPLLSLAACNQTTAAHDAESVVESPLSAENPLPQSAPDDCPITAPPEPPFVPPEPYAPTAPYGNIWYGSNNLWTWLLPDDSWNNLPHSEKGYAQKVFWWSEGYDQRTEPSPQITVTSRRLDGDGPDYEHTGGTNGSHEDMGQFMLTGVAISSSGCWEITGYYHKTSLSFVVWVGP